MRTSKLKRRATVVAVFLLPLGAVRLAGTLFGPADASYDVQATNLSNTLDGGGGDGHVSWPEECLKAGKHAAALRGMDFGPTPFYYEHQQTSITPVISDSGRLTVNVKAIISSDTGDQALIGRTWYQVGDFVPGQRWKITGIDSDQRTVTFTDTDTGRTETRLIGGTPGR